MMPDEKRPGARTPGLRGVMPRLDPYSSSLRSLFQYFVPETSALAIRPFFDLTKMAIPLWKFTPALASELPAVAHGERDAP